jgi:LPS-assembly protein
MFLAILKKVTLALLPLLLFSSIAYAKQSSYLPSLSSENKVNIKAAKMSYDQANNLIHAVGDVIILQEDFTLNADRVTLNTVTQDAKAMGKVTLTEGENILNCERLDINLNTKVGSLSQATLFMKEDNYHITGQTFEKLGENKYRVLHGTVTTCDGEKPDWKITGGEINVTVEGYATLKNSTFQIRNIPIAYFPFFLYPVKTERQSGFLIPDFHYSSSDGVEISNEFYWAISENADATFYMDYGSEKGIGEGVEFRYVLNKRSHGKLYQYYIEERSDYFDDEYNPTYGRNRKRGIVDFEGEHYFNDTSYIKTHGTWLSDRKIYEDYAKEIRRSRSEVDRVSLRSKEKNKSYIFHTKNWSQYSLTTEVNYYKNLIERDRTTLQRVPKISFSGQRQNISGTPLFFKLDSAYDYFSRHHGVEGQRVDISPKISWPFNLNNYVKFTPEIGVRSLFGFGLTKDRDYDHQKAVIDANAELSTTILKVYNFQGKRIAKLKHSIEPSILYRYLSDEDQEEFPIFEHLDRFYERNAVNYSVTNRFTAKVLLPDGSFAEQELGYLKIGQNYYFTHPAWPWLHEGYSGHDFSDIRTELRVRLGYFAYLKAQLNYNPYDNNLGLYNAFLLFQNKRNDYLRFEYRYVRDELEGYRVKLRYKINNSLSAFYETRHSEFNDKTLDSLYALEYYAQCWSVRFVVEENARQDGRDKEIEYAIMFNLAGLGEIGEIEGDLY